MGRERARLGKPAGILARATVAAIGAAGLVAASSATAHAAPYSAGGFVELNTLFSATQAPAVHPGQWVGGGYTLQVAGTAAAQTVTVTQPRLWLQVACQATDANASASSLAGDITIDLVGGQYPTVAGSNQWYPATSTPDVYADGFDPLTYEGNSQAPDLCAGGPMYVNAEAFQANVTSSGTDPLLVRFHAETGSGAIDCGNALQNPAPGVAGCASTWSNVATVGAGTASAAPPAPGPGTTAPAADPSAPGFIMINGSMEGNLQILPNDWIGGGYQFFLNGNYPSATVTFSGATLTLNISCNSNGTNPFPHTFSLSGGPYSVTANSSAKYPFSAADNNGSNQGDPAKWEATQQAPDLCSGGTMFVNAQSGAATFEANVQSTDGADAIHVQFHYIDSKTIDCANTAANQNPPPGSSQCGASWSSDQSVTPGPPNANVPDGFPLLLTVAGAGATGWLGWRMRRRRGSRPV